MKSTKLVIPLSEILLPHILNPKQYLSGNVNGRHYEYTPGKPVEITYQEYESLLHSDYGKHLAY